MSKPGVVRLDVVDGLLDDGEVLQAEEVHLEEADLGDGSHVELGDDLAVLALGEGAVVAEVAVADDDAGGVDAGIAGQALQACRA